VLIIPKYKNLLGKQYGRLKVFEEFGRNKYGYVLWKCKCNCGNIITVSSSVLISGNVQSCGCYHKEVMKKYNTYDLSGEYGIGYTSKGEPFYFDLNDYDKIKNYCWSYDKNKYLNSKDIKSHKIIKMHRLLMDIINKPKFIVDHIFGINYDNRKSELRIVEIQQNNYNHNKYKNNSSGCTGVSYCKKLNKWQVEINYNKQKIYLGIFENIQDAIDVRKEAEIKYFGKYRRIDKTEISMN
jgi:hypothetical protein